MMERGFQQPLDQPGLVTLSLLVVMVVVVVVTLLLAMLSVEVETEGEELALFFLEVRGP